MMQPGKETVKGKRWLLPAGPVSCVQGLLPRILGTSAISLQEGRVGGNLHPSSDEETEAEVG